MRTTIFDKIDRQLELNHDETAALLELTDPAEVARLHQKAYQVKLAHVGSYVYFRGLVEFSNRCVKNCYYCGIRKGNRRVRRYQMSETEIVEAARWAYAQRYGSIVLQAGERADPHFVMQVTWLLEQIRAVTHGELGITLSLGEQTPEVYQQWFKAGAHRYLLRIETTNPRLYQQLHPHDHDFETRRACLRTLREIGYQVGTGVMIGLPGQTMMDLVDDLFFFKTHDIDMLGMGPYIVHPETPLASTVPADPERNAQHFALSLNMIAVARLLMPDINIAATTALQALNPIGREMGLLAGANIIMPNITATQYRADYQLYANKPCLDENAELCQNCLERRIGALNESIGYGAWGDAPHFGKRIKAHLH
jgi:biotin synthase